MPDKNKIVISKLIKYCDDIADYIDGLDELSFAADSKTVSACAFYLGQIGELTKLVSDELKNSTAAIPWHKMYGLRNRIVHDYDGINMSQIWVTVKDDIPKVKQQLIDLH